MAAPKFHVLLPQTSFPMKADLPKREPETLARWESLRLYHKMQERAVEKRAKPFVLHDGPPYANGPIHVGHALNKILKDFIVKFQAMAGRRAPYIPGWDCHGLPIEHQLMKEKGWTKRTVDRVTFRRAATEYAERFIELQRKDFKRLGILGEWENPYKTLTPEYEAGIVRTFYDLVEKGCITQDKKPVYWCASCETALAEAEVEYAEKTSTSIFVKFPVQSWPAGASSLAKAAGPHAAVLVWTTTPWTLPANVALAFHPEATYTLWKSPAGEKFLTAAPGRKVLEATLGAGEALGDVVGKDLEGLLAKNPLNGNDAQGVLADFVTMDDGTGVVHIAPGHGDDDFRVGKAYGLPILSPIDDAGRFTPEAKPAELLGQRVWDANPVIVERLKASGLLLKATDVAHSYPHCWRCKQPVLFRAATQWFLKVTEDFRARLIASVDRVAWTPSYGKERILGMLKTRPDWCLSRQRYWGTPIPMFLCKSCGRPHVDREVFDRVTAAIRAKGGDAWYSAEISEFLPRGAACAHCHGTEFRREEDILDVWFDSGVSWAAVLGQRDHTRGVPREDVMYLEGSDQHRGWFQTSLLPALALTGEPPYGQVLTHGFVLDGSGRAMSKSLGNVIAPQELITKFGADVVRLWVAVTDYREDVRLSPDILDRVVDTYRKIRNTLRFLLGNLGDFVPARHAVPMNMMAPLDLAAVRELAGVISFVKEDYQEFSFHTAISRICDEYCISTLSEYYLDVCKDVLYCSQREAPRRRSVQTALWLIARTLSRALAPILSFTSEETWQTLHQQGLLTSEDEPTSVFLNGWPMLPDIEGPDLHLYRALRRELNESAEKARQAGIIKGLTDAHAVLSLRPGRLEFNTDDETLASIFGVASLSVNSRTAVNDGIRVERRAIGDKCPRCWITRPLEADGLCRRCAEAERIVAGSVAP